MNIGLAVCVEPREIGAVGPGFDLETQTLSADLCGDYSLIPIRPAVAADAH